MSLSGLTEDQRDCLQEVMNVAMGQSADSLARYLEVFVHLSIPDIQLISVEELHHTLQARNQASDKISAVRQAFYDAQSTHSMRGEAIMMFSDTAFSDAADLLGYEKLSDKVEQEILLDISNILNGTCLNGFAEQFGFEIAYSPPSIIGMHILPEVTFQKENIEWTQALHIGIDYKIENHSVECSMMVLMPGDGVQVVLTALDELLMDDE